MGWWINFDFSIGKSFTCYEYVEGNGEDDKSREDTPRQTETKES